jgi:hypothetical protein
MCNFKTDNIHSQKLVYKAKQNVDLITLKNFETVELNCKVAYATKYVRFDSIHIFASYIKLNFNVYSEKIVINGGSFDNKIFSKVEFRNGKVKNYFMFKVRKLINNNFING